MKNGGIKMDKINMGFFAGIIGGIIMNVWSFISYYLLNFTTRRYLDWSGVLLYGRLPQNSIEVIYALFIHFVWVGFLGVVFVLIIGDMSESQGLLVKGAGYGLISGFIIYAIPVVFGIQFLEFTPVETVISNHIGGVIWGLTMVRSLSYMDKKYNR